MVRPKSKVPDAMRCRGTTGKNTRCQRQANYPPDGRATTTKTRCKSHKGQERDHGDDEPGDAPAPAPAPRPQETAIWKIAFHREGSGGEQTPLQVAAPPAGEQSPATTLAVRFEQIDLDEPSSVVAAFPQHRIPHTRRSASNHLKPLFPAAADCTETDRKLVNGDLLTRELAYGPALTGGHTRQTEALAHSKEELLVLRQRNADRDANDPASIYEDSLLRLHHGSTIQASINKKNADNVVVVSAQVETVSNQVEALSRQVEILTSTIEAGQRAGDGTASEAHRGMPRSFRARSAPQIGVAHALMGLDDPRAGGEAGSLDEQGKSDVEYTGIREALRDFSHE